METAAQPGLHPTEPNGAIEPKRNGGLSKRRWRLGFSVASVARAHGINANQLFALAQDVSSGPAGEYSPQCRSAKPVCEFLMRLLPVTVAGERGTERPVPVCRKHLGAAQLMKLKS